MSYQNEVIGNRKKDNKDPKNRQLAQGASQKGIANAHLSPTIKAVQNSKNTTPEGPDQNGDKGTKLLAKRAKKIIRKDTSYTDNAIAFAKRMRGAQ